MINSNILFLFREINEIVKRIQSIHENLEKEEKEENEESWKLYSEYSLLDFDFIEMTAKTYELVHELLKNNDCDVATRFSRRFINLTGNAFEGIVNLMIA